MQWIERHNKVLTAVVWVIRIVVGATFVFSGFVKAVDPWGFMYKITDYLTVWGIDYIPREAIFCLAASLAGIEFMLGMLVALGCLRRAAVWMLFAMMAVMLPLTVYIAIANPVEDCGCFGDAIKLSNTDTLIKNIVLAGLIVALMRYNTKVKGIVPPLFQWIAIVACLTYCVILSMLGYFSQPIVDFRPYKVDETLVDEETNENLTFVYEKGNERRIFDVDNLPDSTWTFVERKSEGKTSEKNLAIFDGDEDVTDAVLVDEGPFVILTVSNPEFHNRARASMANRINEYMVKHGGSMICLVPLSGESLDKWMELAKPEYDVYTADESTIKELARGDAALVYLRDGVVKWKRNLYALSGDFPDESADDEFDSRRPIDSGRLFFQLTFVLELVLVVLILLGSGRLLYLYNRRKAKKLQNTKDASSKN